MTEYMNNGYTQQPQQPNNQDPYQANNNYNQANNSDGQANNVYGQHNNNYNNGYNAYDPGAPRPMKPKEYLVESILVIVFCCLPFGVIGLIKGQSVSRYYEQGNYAQAEACSNEAQKWLIGGAVTGGIFCATLYCIYRYYLNSRRMLIAQVAKV